MKNVYTKKAYLIQTSNLGFRTNEPALIVGVVIFKPEENKNERACFKIEYEDYAVDFVPISDINNYKIVCK